ncbi:MAG TPA: LacI family DNA-binding transcriptional regulator [Terriglobales bacterium]|nr:LacI family DNA-binding transcriptional regulator [Terriglobales bacterium]
MEKKPTIVDIAKALGLSTATVHRALHDHPKTTAMTKNRVLQMAKKLGYKPNLAARYLSSKRTIRISVNTLQGTTSFWDEVRAGIEQERQSLDLENVELEFRTYSLGEGEQVAFEEALDKEVDGIITFPSQPNTLKPLMRRAARANVPVVFVATDAPATGRLSVVSIDTQASGSLAADLIGRIVGGRGELAVTIFDADINEHAEKFRAFEDTVRSLYPSMRVHDAIEDHDTDETAYEQCRKLLSKHPDIVGIYVTTELSIPVIKAARDLHLLPKLTIVTTDLFPALVNEIRSGAVTATIYQRPRTQGRMAFRVLHEFLVEAECPPPQLTLAPHLVMRGNLEFFLQRELLSHSGDEQFESDKEYAGNAVAGLRGD